MYAADPCVGNFSRQAGASGQHEVIVVCRSLGQPVFRRRSIPQSANSIIRAPVCRSSVQRCGEDGVRSFSCCGAKLEKSASGNVGGVLSRLGVVRTRRAARGDNLLGKQVVYTFAGLWLVGGEEMVESAVFTHDDDNVFNGSTRVLVVRPGTVRQGSQKTELHHCQECQN